MSHYPLEFSSPFLAQQEVSYRGFKSSDLIICLFGGLKNLDYLTLDLVDGCDFNSGIESRDLLLVFFESEIIFMSVLYENVWYLTVGTSENSEIV